MTIYEIISRKRDGFELTDEEIGFFVEGFVKGSIKDYQASALLMAIYLQGMTDRETLTLTNEMAKSGEMLDLSVIEGKTADKHSTGGVGDKTTLIVAPIVASLGIKVAKMSGRGLGHTGGTVDKLESIKGFNVAPDIESFISQVQKIGISVVGQTGDLAPADKKIYALRDATATVGSLPLIASSIMSKKLAAGSECIVLDVKTGSGAFMKTPEDAQLLAEKMVTIGNMAGRRMAAVISDMDTPLGRNIGNSLEITEAVEVLKGRGSEDLRQVCLTLASQMISLARDCSEDEAYSLAVEKLDDGSAFDKFREFISYQGGDISLIDNLSLLPEAEIKEFVCAPCDGYIASTDAEKIGLSAVLLGAGRQNKEDKIDYSAGIILRKKTGEKVSTGDLIAELFTNDEEKLGSAKELFLSAVSFSETAPEEKPLIYKIIR